MPPHLGSFAKNLPIYKVPHPFTGKENPELLWTKRINRLKDAFELEGQISDAGDRLVLQDKENIRVLQIYKPSSSFMYYDRSLVSPTNPKYADSLLNYDQARLLAHQWLEKLKLLDKQTFFEGMAYSRVSSQDSGNQKNPYMQSGEKEYNTEIKACFGFKIDESPALGPGAKIMISYAGDTMSQVAYFWRNPDSAAMGEKLIMSPESVRKHLARDPRFAQLDPNESKIRINEIILGYYALPPYAVQEYYFPVYQLKGILETRIGNTPYNVEAVSKNKGSIVKETLQYNFNYFLPACDMTAREYKMAGFPYPIEGSYIF